jgi:hypothetical protein
MKAQIGVRCKQVFLPVFSRDLLAEYAGNARLQGHQVDSVTSFATVSGVISQ